ncbi:hypothetical protein RGQ29_019216 [Quercus rubra]|uniref:Uncharacterized protein n=1 Tax=Quercus rubra TaxID=3512 RepID=A0AAN7FA30_QUERU|nr:hypothetical protein RGQ29_019216 [Quercus rubra]
MFSLHNSTAFLLQSFAVLALTSSINSQPNLRLNDCYGTTGTANASYNSNLASLFESLSSKASQNYSFYNDNSNIGIYSLYLCRGDVSNESCRSCVSSANQENINSCPSSARCADVNFFGKPDTQPWLIMSNVENTTSPDQPNFYARGLMEGLIGRANINDRLFEADEQTLKIGDRPLTSYGLVQCTIDLDVGSCEKCLSDLMVEALNCCESKIGWRISGPSCFLRSLSMHFMDSSMQARDDDDSGAMHYFNLTTILTATNNFSDVNKLGEGGFGPVYKGKLINGKETAVKRLSMKSKQGLEEF